VPVMLPAAITLISYTGVQASCRVVLYSMLCSQLSLQSQLVPHRKCTLLDYMIYVQMILQSQLVPQRKCTLLDYMIYVQMILQSQLVPHRERGCDVNYSHQVYYTLARSVYCKVLIGLADFTSLLCGRRNRGGE
jgi:hypothetical protein